jgi:hypothetical protein
MPEKQTRQRARKDRQEGKSPSTQAGHYVREEMHHAKSGKQKVKNRKQAIAIGLSKARQSGVDIPDKRTSGSRSKTSRSSSRRKSGASARTGRRRPGSRRSKSRSSARRTVAD